MTAKKIIIVLSMHRTGTIPLAYALSTIGVELGDALQSMGMDETASFWEDSGVIAVNNKLLNQLGSAYGRDRVLDVALNDNAVIDEVYQEAKALIADKAPDIQVWGMKDPLMLQLLPFWQKLLKELKFDISYVIVLHSPLIPANSDRNQFASLKPCLLWLEHMLQAVAYTTSENRLIVGYDNWLKNPPQELLRMSLVLDLPAPTEDEISKYINEFPEPGLRHAQHLENEQLNSQIEPKILADFYALLNECALDKTSINSEFFEECLEPMLSALRGLLPPLGPAIFENTGRALIQNVLKLNMALHPSNEYLQTASKVLTHSNLKNTSLKRRSKR